MRSSTSGYPCACDDGPSGRPVRAVIYVERPFGRGRDALKMTTTGWSLGRQFGWLWAAYSISTFGTWVAFDAFPLIAIL
ncbi:MAG: hypothetical protein ACXVFT_08145, partial [Solirubrobacteraceae bacterium]